jgi:UDP-N-acetylglucosamine 2-epimerase (non-hydrolysing)
MYPLIKELKKRQRFGVAVVSTGQHREMLATELSALSLDIDRDLEIMSIGQTLFDLTSRILLRMNEAMEELKPDIVLVHGDTVTAFATALAAFYMKIPVGHIEAGLRTYNANEPYPEEFYRRGIAPIAKYHFAPTELAEKNLIREGIAPSSVFVTGNTVIDALVDSLRGDFDDGLMKMCAGKRMIVFTAHRRETGEEELRAMLRAVKRICRDFPEVTIVYPVHKSDSIRRTVNEELAGCEGVILTEPIASRNFHNILARAYMILTDSGGIQEEAAFLGIPTLVMRNETERKEIFANTCIKTIGKSENAIYEEAKKLISNEKIYNETAKSSTVFGDGFASAKIVNILEEKLYGVTDCADL